MMQLISDHFINVQSIEGGLQFNLGYAALVAVIWYVSSKARRFARRKAT